MSKFWTHRMNLLYFSYTDFWKSVCDKIGITDKKVLERLKPSWKEKKDGVEVGKCRVERYAFWANQQAVLDTSHDDRLRLLEEYIRHAYLRILKELDKEEQLELYFKTSASASCRPAGEPELEQMEFDFMKNT